MPLLGSESEAVAGQIVSEAEKDRDESESTAFSRFGVEDKQIYLVTGYRVLLL